MTQESESKRIKHALLLRLRQGKALSQKKVADLAGMEPRQYARYERGEVDFYMSREDTRTNLTAIAGIYGLKAEDLLEQEGVPDKAAIRVQRPEARLVSRRLLTPGKPIPIQGPWRFGKATLLDDALSTSRSSGASKIVRIDLDELEESSFSSFNVFLHDLGLRIAAHHEPPIGAEAFEAAWQGSDSAASKLGWFLHDRVLVEADAAILVLEHVDRVEETPFHDAFFALLRGWAESAVKEPQSHWPLLRIVVTIATEPEFLETVGDHSGFFAAAAPMIKLGHFQPGQIQDLARAYDLDGDKGGMEQLRAMVDGQPYLVHLALSEAALREVSLSSLLTEVDFRGGVFEQHLMIMRARVDRKQLLPALCEVLQGRKIPRRDYCRAYSIGLLKQIDHNSYQFQCELYRSYFGAICKE